MLLLGGQCLGTNEIEFTNREAIVSSPSANGTVDLEWSNPDKVTVRLEQASDPSFDTGVVRYEGVEESSVLTGLAEGSHYFRVGERESDQWSEPLVVEVKFFPREKLFLLLGLGGIVVLATAGAIIAGAVRNREGGAS